jgi:hypothetical protein
LEPKKQDKSTNKSCVEAKYDTASVRAGSSEARRSWSPWEIFTRGKSSSGEQPGDESFADLLIEKIWGAEVVKMEKR